MGAGIDFTSHVEVADKTIINGALKYYGYKDITPQFIDDVVHNPKVKTVQIFEQLPNEAFAVIDRILERRPDIDFRIFGLYGDQSFDLSCLYNLPHLRHLTLDVHLRARQNMLDLSVLCNLPLISLNLDLFDLRDYSFVQNLNPGLKSLGIFADSMQGSVNFDCNWLLKYTQLETLYLGKKAKKHIKSIAKLPALKNLTLRGIKVDGLDFLRENNLDSFALLWCGMSDISSLSQLTSLQSLELWRIMKLEDLSPITCLTNLKRLKLQDLSHIHSLPDLQLLTQLEELVIDNVPIDINSLPENLQKIYKNR